MHLPDLIDVISQRGNLRFILCQHSSRLVQGPSEVIAVIVHVDVGVLRSIESAALAIAQPLVHPADDVSRYICKELFPGCLIGVHVVLQQFRVVVRHLLEVRHHPAFIHGITMKPARKLVVDPTKGHVLKRGDDEILQLLVFCGDSRPRLSGGAQLRSACVRTDAFVRPAERSDACISLNQQLQRRRMRKLRRRPEPSMLGIKHLERRLLNRLDDAPRNASATPVKRLGLHNRVFDHRRLLDYIPMLLLVSIGNA